MASARATPARATAVPRAFDRLGAPRWTALAVVAMLAFVAIARDAGPATRVPPQAHVTTAGAASIIGVGGSRAAAAGAALLAGDVLVVDPGGRAAVAIGGAELRLAGGAAIELERLGAGEAVLVQMAGRAWFRADTSGPSLIVRSGGMTWTASDATFDVVRGVAAGGARGGPDVVLVVRGSIAFHAADLDGSISQGRRATVTDTGNLPDTRFTTAAPGDLADPWLAENAALDRDQGRPVGILAGVPAGKAVVTIP
jgi:hypothetical protein